MIQVQIDGDRRVRCSRCGRIADRLTITHYEVAADRRTIIHEALCDDCYGKRPWPPRYETKDDGAFAF